MIDQLDLLLAQYEDLQRRSRHDDLSDLGQDSAILANRLQAAIDRIVRPGDTYGRESEAARNEPVHVKLQMLARLAYAPREDLKAGWSTTLAGLVHAETSADMIEMALNLNASRYKDAAVVIVGAALKLHLRQMCPAAGVTPTDSNGKPKKADLLKAELRKQEAFGPVQEKQVTAWLGLLPRQATLGR